MVVIFGDCRYHLLKMSLLFVDELMQHYRIQLPVSRAKDKNMKSTMFVNIDSYISKFYKRNDYLFFLRWKTKNVLKISSSIGSGIARCIDIIYRIIVMNCIKYSLLLVRNSPIELFQSGFE